MQSNSTLPASTDNPVAEPSPVSDTRQTPVKPAKPYPDFPLFPHATGRWAKKIRGQLVYFGKWDDPDGALARYLDEKDRKHAGRIPRADELNVKTLANSFLAFKQDAVDAGELSPRTWSDYKETTDLMVSAWGKYTLVDDIGPDEFAQLRRAIVKRWGLHRIAKHVQYTRSVFIYGVDAGLIERAVRFGPGFKGPSKKRFRLAKAEQEVKLFTAAEIHRMLKAATPSMRAMIMLAINCGFGNADCATMRMRCVDLASGWIDFPRQKTGNARRCPLWPETVQALKVWIADRPTPRGDTDRELMFITAKGGSWMKETSDNPVSKEMAKLLKKLEINSHRNFYTLRHTHRTVSDEVCDQRASGFIMGHVDPSMAGHYVEKISDERLQKVTDHVRAWMYPPAKKGQGDRG